jgi:hypothetical protein
VITYCFIPPFSKAKFFGVPSRTVVKVGCSLGKKNVAEHCCRGHSYDLESRPVTVVLEKYARKYVLRSLGMKQMKMARHT